MLLLIILYHQSHCLLVDFVLVPLGLDLYSYHWSDFDGKIAMIVNCMHTSISRGHMQLIRKV